jgi:hypothetical protein
MRHEAQVNHAFTPTILRLLAEAFGQDSAQYVFDASPLLQYLNVKTRSANKGSKARGSFANHYALYVLVEDYIRKGFLEKLRGQYSKYEGARFTDLFRRQRELPFGAKLQNHALNSRLNDEFSKYFPTLEHRPILRDQREQRYWVNETLLEVRSKDGRTVLNIAPTVIAVIDAYVEAKRSAFSSFLDACRRIADASLETPKAAIEFVEAQLAPNVDARVFEIVSFATLRAHYGEQSIFWGWTADELQQEFLVLYKTGRTNANDGGIDFVMRPLGRFFQVTETIDVNKYFLDIDKVQRFPITFVVKTTDPPKAVMEELRTQAKRKYRIEAVVDRYLESVEEVVNIPRLLEIFRELVEKGRVNDVMDEIVVQSRAEFNVDGDDGDEEADGDAQ